MEDNVTRLINKLKQTFGSKFAAYYDGDPEAIPQANLPAIIVMQTGDDTTRGAFRQDDIEEKYTVKVVFDKRDDMNGEKADPLNLTDRKIRDLVSKRSSVGEYDKQTVKHVVRDLSLEGITAIATDVNVEYGIRPRPGGDGYAPLTSEGHVTFGIEYSVDTTQ